MIFKEATVPFRMARRLRTPLRLMSATTVLGATALLAPSEALGLVSAQPMPVVPGVTWADAGGHPIQAHAGSFLRLGSTYYWFGEVLADTVIYRGISVYSSTDLHGWQYHGLALRVGSGDLAARNRIVERPKVLRNPRTGQFVMWMHIDNADNYTTRYRTERKVGVATASTVTGPYRYRGSFHPGGIDSRDITLLQEPDGAAYLVSSAPNAVVIFRLTDDYLGVARRVATLWPGQHREAPTMVKIGRNYFLITSNSTRFRANQALYASARSLGGPWSSLAPVGSATTHYAQGSDILTVHGNASTSYIFAGDRWNGGSTPPPTNFWNLGTSTYVWLPLQVSDRTLRMPYYGSWSLDSQTGRWSRRDQGCNLSFLDGFADGRLDGWTTSGGSWRIVDSAGKQVRSPEGATGVALASGSTTTRAYAQATVRLDANGGAGVIARALDARRYYVLDVDAGGWRLARVATGASRTLASGTGGVASGTPTIVRLAADGARLTASVSTNRGASFRVLGTAWDSSYARGRAGVRARSATVDDVGVCSL